MNRRVLLIDSDTEFHDALAEQLGRYGLSVAAEAEPEDALTMAGGGAFDVVMIAVEEPDKLGFKTFQKARKQLPAKIPIVLVTASVPPEAFAKHRGLKTHADAYIDKRGGEAEIFQKLDALLELGDPVAGDELPPGDDIPMEIGDGDVVLDEEQVDDDPHGGFEHTMGTVNPGSGVMVDKMVSAETDAAFDALLGDDMFGGGDAAPEAPVEAAAPAPVEAAAPAPVDVVAPAPVDVVEEPAPQPLDEEAPETLAAAEASAIPEPVPHKIPEPEPDLDAIPVSNEDFEMDSVPAAIDDGGAKSGAFSDAALALPVVEGGADEDPLEIPSEADEGATVIGQVAQLDDIHADVSHVVTSDVSSDVIDDAVGEIADQPEPAALSSRDSLSSIPIVDDDLVSLDDEMPVEVEAVDVGEAPAPAPEPEPVAAIPQPLVVPLVVPLVAPPVAMPVAAAEPETKSGGHPAVDLGLDDIAENAEREQSGVYDRKSLRKIGELERTVAQLMTELERAKAAGDSSKGAGASRESQFLNLREQNLAKDKELKQLKTEADARAAELAEAQEKLRQALHAKTALEAKNTQLEDKIFNEGDKEKELTASLTEATTRLGNALRELESKAKAAMAAETALAQLERDLASERATRAASASEAEKTLRVEREQLVQRHKGELAAQQAETDAAREHALARLREELDAARAAAVEHAVEEVRRANAAQHGESLEATTTKHNAELVALKSEHAGELSRIKNDLAGKVSELEAALSEAKAAQVAAVAAATQQQSQSVEQLTREHAQALEQAQQRFEAEIGAREEELEDARAEDAAAHAKALAELKAQVDAAVAEAKAERERHARALEKTAADVSAEREGHAQAREQAAAEARALRDADAEAHERAVAQLRTQRDADAAAHASTLAELQAQLERAAAASAVKLAAAQREVEAARAQAESHVVGLVGQHESTVGEIKKQHEGELAQLAETTRQAAEAHRAALAELQKKVEAQLAEADENAQRELAELRGQLQTVTRAAQEAAARAQAEREELLQAHASQIGELEAKQERAMAVASGEALKAKAVADAEHAKEIAAQRAEADKKLQQLAADHARVSAEVGAEREELKKGLSGARDSLKRSEGELASAVQTIADRNADLRAHAAAIAERDQRITELRAEIESLEQENASYQEQVLRAYQKIKTDEAMVARARKAMAIALTVLDDQGNPPTT